MSEDRSEFEPFTWLPSSSLPAELGRYVDADRPLKDEDRFHASASFSLFYLLFGLFWLVAFASLFVAMTMELVNKMQGPAPAASAADAGLPVVLLVGLATLSIFGVYKCWRSVSQRLAVRQAWVAGKFRDGLFVLDDGLLLHQAAQVLHLPRKAIASFELVHRGRGDPADLQVVYDSPEEGRQRKSLLHLDLEIPHAKLMRELLQWVEDGVG